MSLQQESPVVYVYILQLLKTVSSPMLHVTLYRVIKPKFGVKLQLPAAGEKATYSSAGDRERG